MILGVYMHLCFHVCICIYLYAYVYKIEGSKNINFLFLIMYWSYCNFIKDSFHQLSPVTERGRAP